MNDDRQELASMVIELSRSLDARRIQAENIAKACRSEIENGGCGSELAVDILHLLGQIPNGWEFAS